MDENRVQSGLNMNENGARLEQDVTPIDKISQELKAADLICRIVTINSKEYSKNGQGSLRYFGILEDSSGSIPFSAWRQLDVGRNDIVQITNGKVRQWQGVLSINIVDKTEVTRVTDDSIIKIFQKNQSQYSYRKVDIRSLEPGMTNISCTCRIVSVEPVEVKLKGQLRTVYKGIAADRSGSVRFTAWKDLGLNPDSVNKIMGISVKTWNKFLEMNMNSSSIVNQLPPDKIPPISELPIEVEIPIADLYDKAFLSTPEFVINGTVLEFKSGSGVISRCILCRRSVANEECKVHGKTEIKKDLRLKAIVDDGTGAVIVYIGKELAEEMIGKSLDECQEMVMKGNDVDKSNEQLLENLLVRDIKIKGNLIVDDFKLSIHATGISTVGVDRSSIVSNARDMLEAME